MADISEVIEEVGKCIALAVYPNGTNSPSITNAPIKIVQGWPVEGELGAILSDDGVMISIFPRPGDKVTWERMGEMDWQEQSNDGSEGVAIRELRRQTKVLQVTIWGSSQNKRDLTSKSVDVALSILDRITLPDGTYGIVRYVNSIQDDLLQKQGIYRRDLMYSVNYAITQTLDEYVIKEVDVNITYKVIDVSVSTTS
jgi:hypothetical protein